MFLAGFLLFLAQPMLAKFILPWFGGSATTWTVCMLFFQLALLAGYAWARAATSAPALRAQAVLQLVVLCAAAVLLPITPSEALKPADADHPVARILSLLVVCVGAPYAVLATTSPVLQRWLHHLEPRGLTSRFFAVSNLGSFLGLLSYPFAFEPFVSSPVQTRLWSIGFCVYGVLFAVCAVATLRAPQMPGGRNVAAGANEDRVAGWIVWSSLGSVLLLATTNQIAQWSAVVPFLWVLPLGLYLLTFVAAFARQSLYRRGWFFAVFCVLAAIALGAARPTTTGALLAQLALQCATMFTGCAICHAEMAKLQPPAPRLPVFYLWISIGGALGGAFATLAAPLIFSDYWEHQIVLTAVAALAAWRLARDDQSLAARALVLAGLGVFVAGLAAFASDIAANRSLVVERVRNFYGVVKVLAEEVDDPNEFALVMQQAGVDQGSQYQLAARRLEPACAYGPQSGVGLALAARRKGGEGGPPTPLRIGVIGLGVGMIAGLGVAGDSIRFYEINPAVVDLARRRFSFLSSSVASTQVVHGDGRVLLEREARAGQKQNFDILIVDAFRGASPPIHLMTREAFAIYLEHLAPDGVLAVNFEVEILEAAPLHRGLAAAFGLGVNWLETPRGRNCEQPVSWALYTSDQAFWASPAIAGAISSWRDGADTKLLWRDASGNLASLVNWRKLF